MSTEIRKDFRRKSFETETQRMKNKLNIISLLFLVVTLSVTTVYAAMTVSIDAPAASSIVDGATVNVTVVSVDALVDFNCTIYAQSSLTANSSWSLLGGGITVANVSNNSWNATIDSAGLEDANNYIFNVTCNNGSDDSVGDTNTGITVDNTEPTTPTSLSPTGTITNRTFTFRGTVTDRETTSCTLFFDGTNPGASSYAMTYSGSSCTYDATDLPEQTYNYYVQASDESNTTNSAISTATVDVKTSSGKAALLAQQAGITSKGGSLLAVAGDDQVITGIPNFVLVIIAIAVVIGLLKLKK